MRQLCSFRIEPSPFSLLGGTRRFRRLGGCICISIATLIAGCQTSPPPIRTSNVSATPSALSTQPAAGDPVIATVNGLPISRSQFEPPLVEAYGLPVLLNVVQLTLAKQLVTGAGATVTPADVQAEHDLTFAKLFADAPKADYDSLFEQLLQQRHLSKVEFDLVIETNAYLRKFAGPQMTGKISDDDVHKAFGQLYGENRQVRDMELTNLAEVGEAKRRLSTGEPFEKVAHDMSTDPHTAPMGGELPPFSMMSPNVPDAIKKMAFSLPVGQVSEAINTGSGFHLIVVTRIIAPKVIHFEDVKDSVRKQLEDQWMQLSIEALRNQLGAIALQTLHVDQPELAKQWQAKVDQQRVKMQDRDAIREKMNAGHSPAATGPTTSPAP